MKKWIALIGLVVAGALAFGVWGGAVFAQEPTNPTPPVAPNWGDMAEYCHGAGGMMGGSGMEGFHMGLDDTVTLKRVADILGLTYEQLTARLEQGETIAQVAQAQAVDISLVVTAILAPQSEILQVRVKYGYLSETQAQTILEQSRLWVEQTINQTYGGTYSPNNATSGYAPRNGGGMMGGDMMGGGMMGGGFGGQGMMGW